MILTWIMFKTIQKTKEKIDMAHKQMMNQYQIISQPKLSQYLRGQIMKWFLKIKLLLKDTWEVNNWAEEDSQKFGKDFILKQKSFML